MLENSVDNAVNASSNDELDVHAHYAMLISQAKSLISSEHDLIANLANVSALIFNNVKNINWAGFYLFKDNQLVLGPFQGNVACVRIPMGKGVCGTAASSKIVQRIDNVHEFEGHIACDSASNSEIVVPILVQGRLIGVLDIDSPVYNRFGDLEQQFFEQVVAAIESRYC